MYNSTWLKYIVRDHCHQSGGLAFVSFWIWNLLVIFLLRGRVSLSLGLRLGSVWFRCRLLLVFLGFRSFLLGFCIGLVCGRQRFTWPHLRRLLVCLSSITVRPSMTFLPLLLRPCFTSQLALNQDVFSCDFPLPMRAPALLNLLRCDWVWSNLPPMALLATPIYWQYYRCYRPFPCRFLWGSTILPSGASSWCSPLEAHSILPLWRCWWSKDRLSLRRCQFSTSKTLRCRSLIHLLPFFGWSFRLRRDLLYLGTR